MEALVHLIWTFAQLADVVMVAVPTATPVLGRPFQSVPYRYHPSDQGAVFHTPRFVLVFEGMKNNGSGGGGGMTVAGRHGLIPRYLDGYCRGNNGTSFRHDYDPDRGVAKLEFYGHPFTIHSQGRTIRIKDTDIRLPAEQAVILVDSKGKARLAAGERARALLKKLDKGE